MTTTKETKSTVKISDELMVRRIEHGNHDQCVIRCTGFDGEVSTIKIFDKADAIALAKELMLWAESQPYEKAPP